jgi:hypothetical protein
MSLLGSYLAIVLYVIYNTLFRGRGIGNVNYCLCASLLPSYRLFILAVMRIVLVLVMFRIPA